MAFIPYKADATPGIISTLSISRSLGPRAFAMGAPMWGAWLSMPSTICTKRTLVVLAKPRVLITLKPILGVSIWTPLAVSRASKKDGAGDCWMSVNDTFSMLTGDLLMSSFMRDAVTTTSWRWNVLVLSPSFCATRWNGIDNNSAIPGSWKRPFICSLYLIGYNAIYKGDDQLKQNDQDFGWTAERIVSSCD